MKRSSSRAVTALLVAVVSIPLSSQAIFRSQADIRDQAYEYQSGERQMLRRAYSQAIEAYREKLADGIVDAVKPDINNPSTFEEFLPKGEEIARVQTNKPTMIDAVHSAATGNTMSDTEDLSKRQRILLRNYTRAGSCPPSMERILPGFHALCKNVVGKDVDEELPVGIENNLKALRNRGQEPTTLKLRLKMLEQAKDPATRRTRGAVPMRPTPYTGE